MLTRNELDRRLDGDGLELGCDLFGSGAEKSAANAERRARRLSRDRRLSAGSYRKPGGWSVGLW